MKDFKRISTLAFYMMALVMIATTSGCAAQRGGNDYSGMFTFIVFIFLCFQTAVTFSILGAVAWRVTSGEFFASFFLTSILTLIANVVIWHSINFVTFGMLSEMGLLP
jgi:hypothetical protein